MADRVLDPIDSLEAVSRAISETVNAALAQVGIWPELQSFDRPFKFYNVVLLEFPRFTKQFASQLKLSWVKGRQEKKDHEKNRYFWSRGRKQ